MLVPKLGVEPRRPFDHHALNVARLPIPPLRLAGAYSTRMGGFVNANLCLLRGRGGPTARQHLRRFRFELPDGGLDQAAHHVRVHA